MWLVSLERNVLNAKSHVLFTPLSDTSFFDIEVKCQKKESKMAATIFLRMNPIFLNLGLFVRDLLENCIIFGTTIFLDRRKNALTGENGF